MRILPGEHVSTSKGNYQRVRLTIKGQGKYSSSLLSLRPQSLIQRYNTPRYTSKGNPTRSGLVWIPSSTNIRGWMTPERGILPWQGPRLGSPLILLASDTPPLLRDKRNLETWTKRIPPQLGVGSGSFFIFVGLRLFSPTMRHWVSEQHQ